MFRRGCCTIWALAHSNGQCRARFRLDQRDIGAVDAAIDGDVFTEVARIYGLARLRLGLGHVAGVDGSIGRRVADQHTHRHGDVAAAVLKIDYVI